MEQSRIIANPQKSKLPLRFYPFFRPPQFFLKKEKANFVFVARRSGAEASGAVLSSFVRSQAHEIQHAERSAFFVGITALSERMISFQATTRSARELVFVLEIGSDLVK